MLTAAIGQFGRDARHLMRTEIGEVSEPFSSGQVGSSTMAHKRNPMTFENSEGMFWNAKREFGGVLDTLISEHQRDLVGSSLARNFPAIITYLTTQLDTLLQADDSGKTFLERVRVNADACRVNLTREGDKILAEPTYLALQLYGFTGDAHEVVNRRGMAMVGLHQRTLHDAIEELAEDDDVLLTAWRAIPEEIHEMLSNPAQYTGKATAKTREICSFADWYLST
jgi:adenylosuccinate lyase